MITIIFTSIAAAMAVLIIMIKCDIRKFLGFEITSDVFITVGLGALGAMTGTFAGVVMGIVSGLLISMLLSVAKKAFGYKQLTRKGWVLHKAKWRAHTEAMRSQYAERE